MAWEQGAIGATRPEQPILNPEPFCIHENRGMGDALTRVINGVTFGMIPQCGGCKDREALLNHLMPSKDPPPPIEPVDLTNATRHLMFHLWPVHGTGVWQWHCDQLLANAELFNGRRIVSIVTDSQSDGAAAVQDRLKGFTDEFIILPNDPKLREVVTWVPMLERLETLNGPQDITFSGQAKGTRRPISEADTDTIYRWTKAMWDVCLSRPDEITKHLATKAMVGAFRRFQSKRSGWGPWHFSGTFFWFRNRDVFRRNWRYVTQKWWGTEAWPGTIFGADDVACIFGDNCGDLYDRKYWDLEIERQLQEWITQHANAG